MDLTAGELIRPPELILRLWRNGKNNDRAAIKHLFNGGRCLDMHTQNMVMARTIKDLPSGNYWIGPDGDIEAQISAAELKS